MSAKQISFICLAGILVLGVCGCAPSLIGSDAGVYSRTKLYAVVSGDITSVYQATLDGLSKLELEVTEKAKDVFYAKVVAKGADSKIITIRIEPAGENSSNINIKVSPFGNKERSIVIYEQIKQSLSVSK